MSNVNVNDMSQEASIRKLLQLKPLLSHSDQTRGFDIEHVKTTELSFLAREGTVDAIQLIPFLVSALQNIVKRVEALEARLQ